MGKYNILIGDIVSDEILEGHDLIINPTNPAMLCGSGVCGAIFKKAGVDELENYTQKEFNINRFSEYDYHKENMMKVGEVRITPGFDLGIDIMFVQGPRKYDYTDPVDILLDTYNKMLSELKNSKYKNILLPSLGTGVYGYTHEEVGEKVAKLLKEFVIDKDINIDLVLLDEEYKKYYE